jgi:hypothetical protein
MLKLRAFNNITKRWRWVDAPPEKGTPRTTRYTVSFDTPGLSDGTGYVLFTPTVGDEILDIAIRFPIMFDGTTPRCDVGTAVGSPSGLFYIYGYSSLSAKNSLNENGGEGLSVLGDNDDSVPGNLLTSLTYGDRYGTPKVTEDNPIKVWVTQNGYIDGDDPEATQGVVEVVVTVVTPIDVP